VRMDVPPVLETAARLETSELIDPSVTGWARTCRCSVGKTRDGRE